MNKENNHDFEKSSSILFILMMVANGFNYLFQIVMGRMMEVDIYGELNSLMSIFTIVTLPSLVFNLVVSKYVSEYNQQKRGMVLKFIRNIAVYIIIISVSMIFLGIIWAKKIAGYINVSDEKIIVLLFVVAVAATFSSLVLGTLQGLKRFFAYGVTNLVMPIFKLIGSCMFVYIGWKIYGVWTAMLIGYLSMLIVGAGMLKGYFQNTKVVSNKINQKELIKYCVGSFMANIGITFFTNIDIIFIKHYFSGEESGLYSSASVLAKMILYVSSAVTVALFPMVTEKVSKNQETRGVLKKAFKYGGGLSVATALGLVILRKPMIYILYGSKYMEATRYLIGLSIMVVVLSFASIVINYILALGKIRQLCLGVILGVIISFGLMIIYHRTINQVVLNLVIALSAFLVYMALVIRVEARKSITNVSS